MTSGQMETSPVVSVVVTVYDRVQFLRGALRGVVNQTFRSFEVIVTDDSNNPEIKGICDSFQRSEIHYRANCSPVGVALNLRAAIIETRGCYIAILNDDDAWESDFLERLVTPLKDNPERVLAFGDHWIILEDGRVDVDRTVENTARFRRNTLQEGEIREWAMLAVLDQVVPLAMAGVFVKNAIDWDLLVGDVSGAYDFWLSCLLASSQRPAYYISRRLSSYRVHSLMETSRKSADKGENMVFIYGRLIQMELFPGLKAPLQQAYRDALFVCGKNYLFFDRLSEGRKYFLRSFKTCPSAKAVGGLILTWLPKRIRTICVSSQRMLHRLFAFRNKWGREGNSRQ
jgi:glycosyltransferase involved in cell wall biosynthesis